MNGSNKNKAPSGVLFCVAKKAANQRVRRQSCSAY